MVISTQNRHPIIVVSGLKTQLGGRWVHRDVSFSIYPGEIVAIIGASGCGKTTLLRSLLLLRRPTEGVVSLFGSENIFDLPEHELQALRRRFGMMFQSSALFASMTVLDNILFPMSECWHVSDQLKEECAMLKLKMSGLPANVAYQYPSELSGGMRKRAALARALALDPELLFLDEPSAGLDPESAAALDNLLLQTRDSLGVTQLMVTHDLDTLWRVPDRVLFLGEGRVLACVPMSELVESTHPLIQQYFSNQRAQRFARV